MSVISNNRNNSNEEPITSHETLNNQVMNKNRKFRVWW